MKGDLVMKMTKLIRSLALLAVLVLTQVQGWSAETTTIELTLEKGWNLISYPYEVITSQDIIFKKFAGLISGSIWRWDAAMQKYEQVTANLQAKKGYWVYCSDISQNPTGAVTATVTADNTFILRTGWNCVGPVADAAVSCLSGVSGSVWAWDAANAKYEIVTSISIGNGCWMYKAANPNERYSISGVITGEVVSGVILTLTGAETTTITSGADGTFVFDNLPAGTYRLTPEKTDATFNPESINRIVADGADVTGITFDSNDNVLDESIIQVEAPGTESYVADNFAVKSNVYNITSDATLNEAEGFLTFSTATTYQVGDVIIHDTEGWAKKITAVETVSGNSVYKVEAASLADIMAIDSSFSFNVTPDWSQASVEDEITRSGSTSGGVLQKPFEDYFKFPLQTRSLDGNDIDTEGAINLSNISLCDIAINDGKID